MAQRSQDESEERVILFLKMAPGSQFNDDLVKRVRQDIRLQLSARHMPALVLETQDIPVRPSFYITTLVNNFDIWTKKLLLQIRTHQFDS